MADHFWGYFVTTEEIAEIYLDAGGPLGDLRKDSATLTHLARRCIFKYLLPGHIRVYIDNATAGDEDVTGITYKIGPDNAKLRDIPKDLLARCDDMFLHGPDLFLRLEGPSWWEDGQLYQWRRGDKVMGILEHLDLIESDQEIQY
ncbi:hypothetical protein FRC08_006322 [Ceratobasidium sp. 394]|nr:hypothetical protein FRC08_006322 [Ceratobasidium sp. 394]KAG9093858.1 hypothetical protein FS749_013614 [Ceratobasidium sp. UAMH 11750]